MAVRLTSVYSKSQPMWLGTMIMAYTSRGLSVRSLGGQRFVHIVEQRATALPPFTMGTLPPEGGVLDRGLHFRGVGGNLERKAFGQRQGHGEGATL